MGKQGTDAFIREETSEISTYWVHLQIPRIARSIEVDDLLFVGEAELFDDDVSSMRPRTSVVGEKGDVWSAGAICHCSVGSHDDCRCGGAGIVL